MSVYRRDGSTGSSDGRTGTTSSINTKTTTSSSSSTTTTSSSATTTSSSSTTTTTTTSSSSSSPTTTTTTAPTSASKTTTTVTLIKPIHPTSSAQNGGNTSIPTDDAPTSTPTSNPTSSVIPIQLTSTYSVFETETPSPTPSLQTNDNKLSSSERRSVIAGSAAGFVLLLFLAIGGIFIYRKRKKRRFELLNELTGPTQVQHSRAMLLAGEDMEEEEGEEEDGLRFRLLSDGSREVSRTVGIGLRQIQSREGSASTSTSYRQVSYPPPTTPWDTDADPRSSMEALHHPSRRPQSEANQYAEQYRLRNADGFGSLAQSGLGVTVGMGMGNRSSSGSVFREEGIASSLPEPGLNPPEYIRESQASHSHSRTPSSSASQSPLMPGFPALTPKPSPLRWRTRAESGSAGHEVEGPAGPLARTKNWIERTVQGVNETPR